MHLADLTCPFCNKKLKSIVEYSSGRYFHGECSSCIFTDLINKEIISCYSYYNSSGRTIEKYIAGSYLASYHKDDSGTSIYLSKYRDYNYVSMENCNLSFNDPYKLAKEIEIIITFS